MSNNIKNKIQSIQDTYYQENNKKTFFKKSQKKDCANKVIDEIGLNNLIEKSIYYEEGTNIMCLNYPLFKTFVTDEISDQLISYLNELLKYGKKYYTQIDIKINLDTLTITGLERYKNIFEKAINYIKDYDDIINTCTFINSPSFTNYLISFISNVVGKSRFDRSQIKLIVLTKS